MYRRSEDLVNVGADLQRANPEIDLAVRAYDPIMKFLKQPISERADPEETRRGLIDLLKHFEKGSAPIRRPGKN